MKISMKQTLNDQKILLESTYLVQLDSFKSWFNGVIVHSKDRNVKKTARM